MYFLRGTPFLVGGEVWSWFEVTSVSWSEVKVFAVEFCEIVEFSDVVIESLLFGRLSNFFCLMEENITRKIRFPFFVF